MADPRGRVRRAAASAVLTIVVLVGAIVGVGQTEAGGDAIADVLARARPGAVALASAFFAVAFVPGALRWRALMPAGSRPPALGLTGVWCTGLLLNFTVPGPVGEVGSAWLAHRLFAVPFAGALASGFASRVTGVLTAALLAASAWALFDLPVPPEFQPAVAAAALVMAAGGGTLATLAARPTWWKRLAARVLGDRAGLVGRLRDGVGRVADALAEVATGGRWVTAVGWAAVGHLCVAAGVGTAIAGLGGDLAAAGVVFSLCGAIACSIVAFMLPGSQLAFDGILLALLVAVAGAPVADAAAAALLLRVVQLATMVGGALVTAWRPLPPME